MPETEIVETETPVETEETVENPAAVLAKNRALLADLAKLKTRTAALEDLARDLGIADDDLADPRAAVAKRAETSKTAAERARAIREAALRKVASGDRRFGETELEEILGKIVADPSVTINDAGKVDIGKALDRAVPRRPAPGLPPVNSLKARPVNPPATFEALQALGSVAASQFALAHPKEYGELRADFERKLASGAGIK